RYVTLFYRYSWDSTSADYGSMIDHPNQRPTGGQSNRIIEFLILPCCPLVEFIDTDHLHHLVQHIVGTLTCKPGEASPLRDHHGVPCTDVRQVVDHQPPALSTLLPHRLHSE